MDNTKEFNVLNNAKLKPDRIAFDVYDESGEVLGSFYKDTGKTSGKEENISVGDTVYRRKSTGEISPTVSSMMSMTYGDPNKIGDVAATIDSNGKITVKAPAMAKQNELFREQANPVLETISANYKLNKDYKYALFKDSDETKTSEEWLEDFSNGGLRELAVSAYARESDKYRVRDEYGVELNDEQIITKNTNGLSYDPESGKVVTSNDYTALALPESVKDLEVFKDLEDYDNGITTVGAFKEKWDRGGLILNRRETSGEAWDKLSFGEKAKMKLLESGAIGNADSDADFLEVYNTVNDYFAKGDFSDKDEFARMYALRSFISKNAPETSFFMGAYDTFNAFRTGVVESGVEVALDVGQLLETANTFIDKQLYGYDIHSGEHLVSDFLKPEFERIKTEISTDTKMLDPLAGTVLDITSTVAPLIIDIAVGNAVGEAAAFYGARALVGAGNAVEKGALFLDGILYDMAPAAESVSKVARITGKTKVKYLDDLMDVSKIAGETSKKYGALSETIETGSVMLGKSARTAKTLKDASNIAERSRNIATVADILTVGTETASDAEKLISLSKIAASVANSARTNLMFSNKAARITKMLDSVKRVMNSADAIVGGGNAALGSASKLGYIRKAKDLKGLADATKKSSKIAKVAMTLADIQAQATVDVMLSDPGLFREFIINADDESRAYIVEQMAWNYGGFAAFGAAELAFKGFSKTGLGMLINSDLAHMGAGVQYGASELGEKIKTFIRKGKSTAEDIHEKVAKAKAIAEKNPGDAKALKKYNALLNEEKAILEKEINRKANKTIFKDWYEATGKNAESLLGYKESIESYKNLLDIKSEANIQINRIWRSDISSKIARMAAEYDDWADTRKVFLDKVAKALELEKKFNIDAKDAINLGRDSILARTLARSSNDYVSKAYRSEFLEDFIEAAKNAKNEISGDSVAKAKTELEGLYDWIKKYKEGTSAELVEALNEVLESGKNFSGMTQTVKVRLGVMDKDELEGMRSSDVFRRGYMRQQRMPKTEAGFKRMQNLERKELRGLQEVELGADPNESYQDIVMVLFDDVELAAKESYRKEATSFFKKIGFKVETTISGDELSGIRKSQKLENAASKKIDEGIKSVFSDAMLDDIFSKQIAERELQSGWIGMAQGKANQSLLELQKLKNTKTTSRAFKTTAPERRKFVRDLDDGQIDELLVVFQDNPFFDVVEDDATFRVFADSLDSETKNMLFERISNSVERDTSALSDADKILSDFNSQPKYNKASFEKALGKEVKNSGAKSYYSLFVDENSDRMVSDLSEIKNVDESWAKIKKDYLNAKREEGVKNITPTQFREQAQRIKDSGVDISFEDFQKALQSDATILSDVKRSYILNSNLVKSGSHGDRTVFGEKIANLDDIIANAKREEAIFNAEMVYSSNKQKLDDLLKSFDVEGINTELSQMFNGVLDDVIESVAENSTLKKTLSSVTKNYDEAVEYSVLKRMVNGNGKASKEIAKKFSEDAKKFFNNQLRNAGKDRHNAERIAKKFERHAEEWFNDVLEDRYLKVCNRLISLGEDVSGDGYVDYFAKIGAIADSITERKNAEYVVKTFGESGKEEYVIVDPIVSSIFSDVPVRLKQAGVAGKWNEANKIFCQTFRAGTTGALVPASLVRQGFRDTAQAIIVGNAIDSVKTVKNEMVNVFGQRLADELSQNMPDLFDYLKKNTKSETELFEKLVAREEAIGMAGIAAEFESNLYKYSKDVKQSIFDQISNSDEAKSMALSERVSDFLGKFEGLNNMREEYLRKRVYMNAMRDGLEIGLSNDTSRMYAEFMRSEATTNFGRGVYHLNNLAESVPYFRSAINGAKSFWRLYAIDPVGITTRMVTGLIIPAIALTTASLSNDEDKRIYKQIPEYEKDGNLVMVMNGQIMSIPIPQEMGKIINPIRTIVEKIHDGNDKSFGDLMMNNLVGFSPVNLQGFLNVDADRLLSYDSDVEEFVQTRLLPGASKMLSGMLPPLEKSAVMMLTKKDPFTGKDINIDSWKQDDETGELVLMESNESELATTLALVSNGKIPAGMAEAVLKNLFGKGNRYIQDAIPSLINNLAIRDQSLGDAAINALASTGEKFAENAVSPLNIELYGEQTNLAWSRGVRAMTKKKSDLENDEQYKKDIATLNNYYATDEAKDKAYGRIVSRQEEFQKEVKGMVDNLINEYQGTFDRNKFTATIKLMTFDNNSALISSRNSYGQYLSDEQSKLNRDTAIESMVKLGFSSANDDSILGYYNYDSSTGKAEIKYNSPLTILNFENSTKMQDKMSLAAIRDIITDNNIYEKHEAIKSQTDALWNKYNAKGVSSAKKKEIKNEISAVQINWNAEVAAALAPYVSQMTPEAAINNKSVLDYLYTYIEVPESYKTNDKGGYVNLGSDGNKKKAYIDSYIKRMYKINDPYKGQY